MSLHRLGAASLFALVLLVFALATPASAQGPDSDPQRAAREAKAEADLAALRRRVAELVAEQRRSEVEKSATLTALRETDRRVSEAQASADAASAEALRLSEALLVIEAQREVLSAGLSEQRAQLARLLRAAYAAGRHQQLKLLLAQDQLGSIGRTLAYYRHIQQQRAVLVRTLIEDLAALATLTEDISRQQADVAAAAVLADAALTSLNAEREARRITLVSIESAFANRAARLAVLGRDQRALELLLDALRNAIADIPQQLDEDRPFLARRGELPPPVQDGTLRERFGATLAGGQRSEGQRFAVPRGAPVRAVAPGRVAFADWLRGHGLLLVLDHGGGWMTLYAHGDRLERGVGDWVQTGDIIARAGSSGGQSESGLYFELRRDGKPVDPRGWWR